MGLSNTQYEQLMREYSRMQSIDLRDLNERREAAYQAVPELEDLDQETASFAVLSAKALLSGDDDNALMLRSRIRMIAKQREELLKENGFPADQLKMRYHCPDCEDTGYIGSQKCHCFHKRAVDLFYTQSGLRQILQEENFDTFSLDWYDDESPDPLTHLTPRENMERIRGKCLSFVHRFDEDHPNLLLWGGTGLGKTFLSHCIARELIETTHSVMYYSAAALFDALAKETFGRDPSAEPLSAYLQEADLLIIDDLGTELTNAFVVSRLFSLISDRIGSSKSTLISTNLSLSDFADTYTERIFSRITSSYTVLKLYGEDVRIRKKLAQAHSRS